MPFIILAGIVLLRLLWLVFVSFMIVFNVQDMIDKSALDPLGVFVILLLLTITFNGNVSVKASK